MTFRGMSLLLAPLCALAFAACGDIAEDSAESFQGEQRNVAQAVEDLQDAGDDGEEEEICSAMLSDRLRAAIQTTQGRDCPEGLEDFLTDADEFELTAEEIVINGPTATVQVTSGTGGDEREDQLTFIRDGQTWRLDSLGN